MANLDDRPSNRQPDPPPEPDRVPRFGRVLLACLLAIAFCGWLVWFAMTYLPDCCGP